MPATQSPLFAPMYRSRGKFAAKAAAQEQLSKAYTAMAAVTEADDLRKSYVERAHTAHTLAELFDSSVERYDRAIYELDNSDGDERLVAAADAAQLVCGFDDRDALANYLASDKGGLTEDEADRAATLFWGDKQ